jgi:hypothetical protein
MYHHKDLFLNVVGSGGNSTYTYWSGGGSKLIAEVMDMATGESSLWGSSDTLMAWPCRPTP